MDNLELIDQYLDNRLTLEQARQVELTLQKDVDLQQLAESLRVAREAIQFRALNHKLKGLHKHYVQEVKLAQPDATVLALHRNPVYTWGLRIAASLLFCALSYSTYQVAALNPERVYTESFIPYDLPTARGNAQETSGMESAYVSGDYTAVTSQFTQLATISQRDYFLAGVSYLQQKKYDQALTAFAALRQLNTRRPDSYFEQETDYYVALAYLGAHKADAAYAGFKAIYDNPRHLYHTAVTGADLLKLQVLLLK